MRQRRLENEWALLQQLAAWNPGILEVVGRDDDVFRVVLHNSPGALHAARIRYPRFFPSVPIEAFLERPIAHPNVHPETGFVCLWSRFSAGDTIVEALRQLQRITSWQLWNESADHLMQPEALALRPPEPLPCNLLRVPAEFQLERTYAQRPAGSRRRLFE